MIQGKLISISLLLQIPKRSHNDRNNNVYKRIWKNGHKEYNEKCICCFSTVWNLRSAITYKCGRVVLFLTSVYFAISKLIQLFSYSFHVPRITLSSVYYYFFTLCVPCFLFFLIDHNQKQVLLTKWVIVLLKLKNIFFLFLTFWKWSHSQRCFDVDQLYETWRWK